MWCPGSLYRFLIFAFFVTFIAVEILIGVKVICLYAWMSAPYLSNPWSDLKTPPHSEKICRGKVLAAMVPRPMSQSDMQPLMLCGSMRILTAKETLQ